MTLDDLRSQLESGLHEANVRAMLKIANKGARERGRGTTYVLRLGQRVWRLGLVMGGPASGVRSGHYAILNVKATDRPRPAGARPPVQPAPGAKRIVNAKGTLQQRSESGRVTCGLATPSEAATNPQVHDGSSASLDLFSDVVAGAGPSRDSVSSVSSAGGGGVEAIWKRGAGRRPIFGPRFRAKPALAGKT
jgi:hypothetical protein